MKVENIVHHLTQGKGIQEEKESYNDKNIKRNILGLFAFLFFAALIVSWVLMIHDANEMNNSLKFEENITTKSRILVKAHET